MHFHFLFFFIFHFSWPLFDLHILFFSCLELHIFEVHVMYSRPGWLQRVFRTVDKIISEAWHNSAYLLLNRLFEKWEPSNQEAMKTFTQLLQQYHLCFVSARKRVVFDYELTNPFIKVSGSF